MQIQPPSGFSASLELDGLPVLVCGGGPAALSAVRRLLESGAVVTVVAPEIGATVADLATRGLLTMRRRPPAPDDFRGAALVVPASGVAERDQMIAAAARDVWVRDQGACVVPSLRGNDRGGMDVQDLRTHHRPA